MLGSAHDIDRLIVALEISNAVEAEALAIAVGINPSGSQFDTNPLLALDERQRYRRLLALRASSVRIEALPPPPSHPASSMWVPSYMMALNQRDYPGLGGSPRFSVAELRRQGHAMPEAVRGALMCAVWTPNRQLRCQALRCNHFISVSIAPDCRVCSLCLMGIYCPACAGAMMTPALCRVCLLFATVTRYPTAWMEQRRPQVQMLLSSNGIPPHSADADVGITMLQCLGGRAARRLLQPST